MSTLTFTVPVMSTVAQPGSASRLHAMIIGINSYKGRTARRSLDGRLIWQPIKHLKGCVNDARVVEAAVRPLARTVHVFHDEDISRARLFAGWKDMMAGASRGDTLLLTFAGHGGQEPERAKGNEKDGLDETLILSAFDGGQPPATAERIVDDEVNEMFMAARDKGLIVVFVVDACHSGTPTRSVDPRLSEHVGYRTVHQYDFASELAGGASAAPGGGPEELPNVLVLTGAQDDEVVPELHIDGQFHGALSVAVARALSGAADANQDGVMTGDELSRYVIRHIRAITDSGQHPKVTFPTPDARMGLDPSAPLFSLPGAGPRPKPPAPPRQVVRLKILGLSEVEQVRLLPRLRDAELVGREDLADLVWDAGSRDVLNQLGNKIADEVEATDLQRLIGRHLALDTITRLSADRGLSLRLVLPGEPESVEPSRASDRTHRAGTVLRCVVTGRQHPFFVLFNLTGNGKVEALEPRPGRGGQVPRLDQGQTTYSLLVRVGPPFGADHVVAVASESPLNQLVRALAKAHETFAFDPVVEALLQETRIGYVRVGYQGIYTSR